jgi:hypothetical protein
MVSISINALTWTLYECGDSCAEYGATNVVPTQKVPPPPLVEEEAAFPNT